MGEALFVILLITGVCVTFTSTSTLIKGFKSWFNGKNDCSEKYTSLITVDSSSLNDKLKNAWSLREKVWIGLRAGLVSWTWLDGQVLSYFNWGPVLSDNPYGDLCAVISDSGAWTNLNCSLLRPSVCSNENYFTLESEMSWTEARANCEDKNLTLVQIPDNYTNDDVRGLLPPGAEAWIGLSRSLAWYWSDTGGQATFLNWEPGQPDNLSGNELCAALLLGNGTWSDEPCDEPYYFICQGPRSEQTSTSSKTEEKEKISNQMMMNLKLQTTANLEDGVVRANLERQLRATLANRGVTDFKLAWRKLPEKKTEVNFEPVNNPT